MVYLLLFFTSSLLFSSDGGTLPTFGAFNQTSQFTRRISRRETPLLPPPYLRLPVFLDSRLPLVKKEYFSPSEGTGLEPLPELVRRILLPVRPLPSSPPIASGVSVTTSCDPKKMYVQVDKDILGTVGPESHVKLGTCGPSKSTRDHLYFEYDFDRCGTKQTLINNQVAYFNTLKYDPPKLQGPIRRSAPFSLPVSCNYNRYQYSYKVGYKPKLQMRKIFQPMRQQAKFILTPRNAQWERHLPSDQYVLGKPMFFEAEGPSMSSDERLYIHQCYATPEKSHTSMPQFQVVKNFGCMVESKVGRSRFIPYQNNAVRFSVDAFLFRGMTSQQLYMHCSMSVGSSVPTPTAKACNYDTKARRWVELYGKHSVCNCCDSGCSSAGSTVTKMVSSRPWTVETKVKPSRVPKRKTVSQTISPPPTTTTTTTAPPPEMTTMTPIQPEVKEQTETGKVEDTGEELEWPFGGEGVQWVEFEEEEEEKVKGSAAVVVEEEEEEVVTPPRMIFEDIFDFDE